MKIQGDHMEIEPQARTQQTTRLPTEQNMKLIQQLTTHTEFIKRHIGPSDADIQSMLKTLNVSSLEELVQKCVPTAIQRKTKINVDSLSETAALEKIKKTFSENKIFKNYIGMGYYDTLTPKVILRNVLENPSWYTQYTPYQAEISQGRLETLLNFQTLISELTGLEIANASLLDEGTACAEAMTFCQALAPGKNRNTFFVSETCHPQSIEVVQTRAKPMGINVVVGNLNSFQFTEDVFGALVQYPDTYGNIDDLKSFTDKAHANKSLVAAACDLLSLTALTPPGAWGADVAIGSSQRFGVPMGFGGPHAAFFSTKEEYKRRIPGRLVGVSVDRLGKPAIRLALQTREQHIRRDKATSNICTAQVLLANMATFYAIYHGPQGLKKIADRTHILTQTFRQTLETAGYKILNPTGFDTLSIKTKTGSQNLIQIAEAHQINIRKISDESVGVSFDETTTLEDLASLAKVFGVSATIEQLNVIAAQAPTGIPAQLKRTQEFLMQDVFNKHQSETEMLRYLKRLQDRDLSLTTSMIPLGSCTMKLNATSEMIPVTWPEVSQLHPFAPLSQAQGYLKLFTELEAWLSDITGFDAVSLQPNAGSQGEYAGLLVIRKFFEARNESHRNICLIPVSAHGTNPASAVMAGFQVIGVACDTSGNIDVTDLKEKIEAHKQNLGALMVTYPSTHGVFEESIQQICELIHAAGGQVYLDGANMNAMVGTSSPGIVGADVCHLNLHKTFCIPHGGGGPGIGPIGVRKHLAPYLPGHGLVAEFPSTSSGAVSAAPWGSASILPISWMYIQMMGAEGLLKATQVAILNANYIAEKLKNFYPTLYKGKNGFVAHECILDLRSIKETVGITVEDVAKRLMDYGFHAPTMSWPVIGTLMVEPTESESKDELDRFCDAMISIFEEIEEVRKGSASKEDNVLKNAPHTALEVTSDDWKHAYSRQKAAFPKEWVNTYKFWPAVSRVDNAHGDKNLICTCDDFFGKN